MTSKRSKGSNGPAPVAEVESVAGLSMSWHDGVLVVRGEIDALNAEALQAEILRSDQQIVRVDMSQVWFVNSSALDSLTNLRSAPAHGRSPHNTVVLVGASPEVLRLLSIASALTTSETSPEISAEVDSPGG